MKLVIYGNENFEDERALFDLENEEILIHGNYDDDKISPRIEGYLQALEDHNIYTNKVPFEWIDSNHKHHKIIGFY